MTEEGRTPRIIRQIEDNLWAIFASIFAAFSAYLIGTTTTDHRLTTLEKQDVETAADLSKIEDRLNAVEPRVERLDVQAEIAREQKKDASQ
jgi:hypothetical protein